MHWVVDSTGLKIFGEGEWKNRKQGKSKRRKWRKLHVCVDSITGEIEAVIFSEDGLSHADAALSRLDDIDQSITDCSADGAYAQRAFYAGYRNHIPNCQINILHRKNARNWQHGNCNAPPHPRDENLSYNRRLGSNAWKRDSTYHQRSLSETAMFRINTIFGNNLSTRLIDTQRTLASVFCRALNIMTRLSMPESFQVLTIK